MGSITEGKIGKDKNPVGVRKHGTLELLKGTCMPWEERKWRENSYTTLSKMWS